SSLTSGNDLNAFVSGASGITNVNDIVGGGSGWVLMDARGVNSSGNIVGWGVTNSSEHAYLLQGASLSDITPFAGGTNSYALGLNDSNVVVGAATLSGGATHAF